MIYKYIDVNNVKIVLIVDNLLIKYNKKYI